MAVAETPLVKKNHQISVAVQRKDRSVLLIENQTVQLYYPGHTSSQHHRL